MYYKTGAVSALVALIVTLGVDFNWGSAYAMGSLLGVLNWFFLGGMLIGLTQKNLLQSLFYLKAKLVLLVLMFFLILPAMYLQTFALICGFSTFLLICMLEAFSLAIVDKTQAGPKDSRPLPKDWRTLFLGNTTDA